MPQPGHLVKCLYIQYLVFGKTTSMSLNSDRMSSEEKNNIAIQTYIYDLNPILIESNTFV